MAKAFRTKGSEGGTKLRNVLLSLSSPTKNGAAMLEQLGVSIYDAKGNMRQLDEIMGDLNKRRGRIMGMNPIAGGKQVIEAEIPSSEIYGYSTDLRSMTGGTGDFEYEFNRYEPAPSDVQQKEIEMRKDKLDDVSDD